MPHIESEVLEYAMMVVKEHSEAKSKRFSERQIRRIALHVVKNDKLHESDWIEDYVIKTHDFLSEKRRAAAGLTKHSEFSGFKVREFDRFSSTYGEDAIEFMRSHLQDLSQIAPPWAAQFISAVRLLGGYQEVERQAVEHELSVWEWVTQKNPEIWKQSRKARQPWINRARRRPPSRGVTEA